ncbi:MAG: AAA family ATPase [Haliscomenobacter sp.]|uniref:AAA family ATPase n=1 Tax=Haliscomenobacter sp. TaxID=2717303 RepID=UPI0029A9A972|nr:AAA family ATPase [Haliscomenobacter sp.]MDX2069233.1 AAA family ATPase [Haliscomenobacter sp.]
MVANQGKIEGLSLSNFTCFADLDVSFSEGINVIIGENGLGKTHLLKISLALASAQFQGSFSSLSYPTLLFPKLPQTLLEGVQKSTNQDFFLNLFGITDKVLLKRNIKIDWNIQLSPLITETQDLIFIPVNEMLSWYKGFIPAYENRESSIDYVYYLLAKKLAPLPLKGDKLKEQKLLIRELENELGFEVVRDGDEFLIAFTKDQVHNTKLVANGINKLAQLIYLIMNGSLTKDSIIFWDEPEAGLNPKYIVLVAKFLQTLAKAGCQIFVATHDYLLSHTLSLAAEYREVQPETPAIRFHSLYKTQEGTQIESAETLPEIQHNSILDEYSRFYKIEEELFYQSMNVKG